MCPHDLLATNRITGPPSDREGPNVDLGNGGIWVVVSL
jgi:hypothetical protein